MQPDTNEDTGSFHGRCVMYAPLSNGHRMRLLYKSSQLEEFIYPDLKRSLQEGGFQVEANMWKLLQKVAVGGTMSLNGPRFPNPKSYKLATMQAEFMRAERTLAHALLTAVFCKEVPYGCSPISFKEVSGCFKFDTDTAFRRATHVFRAENESEKDLYRITIEGTGHDLSMHRFTFEPSLTWLCRRYPDKSGVTASSGGAIGSDSASDSRDPPQQVADGDGGGDGDTRLSAESEPLVRESNRSLYSFQIQVTSTAVLLYCAESDQTLQEENLAEAESLSLLGSWQPKGHKLKKAEVNTAIRRRRPPPPPPAPSPQFAHALMTAVWPGPTWQDPDLPGGAMCCAESLNTLALYSQAFSRT